MNERAFEMASSAVRFGAGVTLEIGSDLADWGIRRVGVITDPRIAKLLPMQRALESLEKHGIEFTIFDRVRVEPTDASFLEGIEFAKNGAFAGYVAVGGGSV